MHKFKLMLSLHTGWTLSDIDLLPIEQFNSYFALNILSPFTYDVQSEREGLLIAETVNQRRKKQIRSWDLFPYMKPGTPEWLSDPLVQKARTIIENVISVATMTKQEPKLDFIHSKIREEIEIEAERASPNILKIKELKQLLP